MDGTLAFVARRFIPLTEVSEILDISAAQAYALVRSGDLPAIKVGGRGQWRVETVELVVAGRLPAGGDQAAGLGVHPLDVVLELDGLHAPLAAAADLDRRQVAAAHQGVGLGGGDVEDLGHLGQGDEAAGHVVSVPSTVGRPRRTVHRPTPLRRRARPGSTRIGP